MPEPRIFTSDLIDGERILREIPTRLPTPYQEWAAEQSANLTRSRLYERNAGLWLKERLEALIEQADFTPSVALRELLAGYERKAAGL